MSPETVRRLIISTTGVVIVVAVWWLIAATWGRHHHIPTPPEVLSAYGDNGFGYYRTQFGVTIREALKGGGIGVLLAIVLSAVVLLVPAAEPLIMQVAVVTYCIPLVAIAPVLTVVLGTPDQGATSGTAVALAVLAVFFTTVVGSVLGFRSADPTSLDVVSVYGGGRVQQLWRVQLISALPGIVSALQIAAPGAFLGAIIGEFLGGGVQVGVGPALVQTQTSLNSGGAWSLGLGCAVVAGVGYAVFGLIGRLVTPWSKGVTL